MNLRNAIFVVTFHAGTFLFIQEQQQELSIEALRVNHLIFKYVQSNSDDFSGAIMEELGNAIEHLGTMAEDISADISDTIVS